MPLDHNRVHKLLGMVGSDHEGERVNAVTAVDRLLRQAKMTWSDLLQPAMELCAAIEAATQLVAALTEARAEIDRLRGELQQRVKVEVVSRGKSLAVPHQGKAAWALDLNEGGEISLNEFECDFLETVRDWRGNLTERQRPVFERIMDRIARRWGLEPFD